MRLVQTRNKRLVFGVLLSVLVVCVGLTLGQIPLAVSQPVTIPVGKITGPIPMDAANPVWESVPGIVAPLSGQTITTPMHPNISVKTVMIKMATNGKEIGVWANWGDQTLNNTTIGPSRFPGSSGGAIPCANSWSATVPMYGPIWRNREYLAVERRMAKGLGSRRCRNVGCGQPISFYCLGLLL